MGTDLFVFIVIAELGITNTGGKIMGYEADWTFNYFGPTKVIFGVGMISDLPLEVGSLGKKALLVTDPGIIATGMADQVEAMLGGSLAGVYSDIPQDTGIDIVDQGAEYARSVDADVVVSLGGGSAIDTAKGICILLTEGGNLKDYQGMQLLTRPQTPHVVIPTTAGTGSEVTIFSVVLDKEQGQKIFLFENYNIPRVAILDPKMTEKLPPGLTASTGMDAMTHAVEAYVSQQRNPISDGMALHAIRLINTYLPQAVEDGSDMVARGQMQIAALIAGWAFSNAMVGMVHAMAHSLGAVCRTPHGLANGILLPHGMRYNLEEIPDRMADIADALGVETRNMSPVTAGEAGITEVEALVKRIGMPTTLKDAGVKESKLEQCSELAVTDGAIVYNPRFVMDPEEVLEVYRKAYFGGD
jgi:alcohol dehydrogenase class IV